MNKFTILFIFTLLYMSAFCQHENVPRDTFPTTEYYKKDTIITKGNDFVFNIDYQFCRVKTGKFYDNYTPYQVSEFSYNNKKFIAHKVQLPDSVQKVFLEWLVEGKTNLYYYGGKDYKTFFISKDNTNFIEIPFRNSTNDSTFRMQLARLVAECPHMLHAPKLVRYKTAEMKLLFTQLNECKPKYFPFIRYGVTVGSQNVRLHLNQKIVKDELSRMNYQYNAELTAGVFADIPILPTSFSVYTSLNLTKHGFSSFSKIGDDDVDFILNLTTLKAPLMLKYNIPFRNFRPYIGGGVDFSYHISNKAELYKINKTDRIYDFYLYDEFDAIDNFQYGVFAEIGVEQKISYRNYVSLGVRYSRIKSGYLSFGSSEISVLLSLNL